MRTRLKCAHEEQTSDGKITLGVVFNYSFEVENDGWKESFVYSFNHSRNMYTFFDTMVDMFDYMLYRDERKKRAFMSEEEFDSLYDAEFIDGKFSEHLKWA